MEIRFGGNAYCRRDSESVLETLLRHGAPAPYSCAKGKCLSCLLRLGDGQVPEAAQASLRESLKVQGYFLACQCIPDTNISVALADDPAVFGRVRVEGIEKLGGHVVRVRLRPMTSFSYRAAQFIKLRRADGLTRSYSVASAAVLDSYLEIHVKRLQGGMMSNWIHDRLA